MRCPRSLRRPGSVLGDDEDRVLGDRGDPASNLAPTLRGSPRLGDFRHALDTHFYPLNSKTFDCLRGSDYGGKAPRSYHSGGVNALFGDGTVRFVKDSLATATWMALGTRGGGEVVSADAY